MITGCGNSYAIPTIHSEHMDEKKKEQSRIEDFFDYFRKLSQLREYIAVIAIKDTPGHKFNENEQRAIEQVGLVEKLENKHWCSYIAMFDEQQIYFEQISKIDDFLKTDICIDDEEISVFSGALHAGNRAGISINGYDYSVNERGFNIVLWDKTTSQVFDSVNFDTHVLKIPCHRKIHIC